MNDSKGFLEALFDMSFTAFITVKIVKLLYGLSILAAALVALSLVVIGFQLSAAMGVFSLLILAPLGFLLMVAYSRVMLEIIIVLFRVSEHAAVTAAATSRLAGTHRGGEGPGGA